jgi:hypothetical protein
MKNTLFLIIALVLIGVGIFLGIGIRTKSSIIERPINLAITENKS